MQLWQAFFILRQEKEQQKPGSQKQKEAQKNKKIFSIDNENAIKLMLGTDFIK